MKFEVIGIEVGVLLSPDNDEFDDYSCVNKDLPFGFFDEDQFSVGRDRFDEMKEYVLDYVKNGVEKTYGIVSVQEPFEGESMDEYDSTGAPLDYECFKDKDFILYSIAKIDGKLVEGFLEAELDKLAQKDIDSVIENATCKCDERNLNTSFKNEIEFDKG